VITDNLPEGLELVKDSVKASDKDAKVEVDGNNIQVTFNNVTGESSVNVTFEAKVTDKAGKTVKNVALVEGTDPNNPDKPVEPKKPEVETPVKPVIPTGKLEATKTADKKE
ncbi:isopeptide-forming domain-containing fimbrial protein, partial [Vagococcus fluvialis]|uniref:isopeptide-forming domain-containing fimbrial protein n=1 Tax=Vagococcus fluvialis TaxID=2738 RepID=UPI003D0C2624